MSTLFRRLPADFGCLILPMSCSSVQATTPSAPIGLVPLETYKAATILLAADITFTVSRIEKEFNSGYTAKSNSIKQPAINGQMAFAVELLVERIKPANLFLFLHVNKTRHGWQAHA